MFSVCSIRFTGAHASESGADGQRRTGRQYENTEIVSSGTYRTVPRINGMARRLNFIRKADNPQLMAFRKISDHIVVKEFKGKLKIIEK